MFIMSYVIPSNILGVLRTSLQDDAICGFD